VSFAGALQKGASSSASECKVHELSVMSRATSREVSRGDFV
jgi:hypothetical protein